MAYFADLTAHHKNMKVNDRGLGVIIYQTVFKQLLNMKVIWDQRPEYGSVVQQSGFSSWMGSKGPQRLVLWGFQSSSLLALWSPRPKKLVGLSRVEAWTLQGAGVPMPKRWWSKLAMEHPPCFSVSSNRMSFDGRGDGVGWQVDFAAALHLQLVIPFSP